MSFYISRINILESSKRSGGTYFDEVENTVVLDCNNLDS